MTALLNWTKLSVSNSVKPGQSMNLLLNLVLYSSQEETHSLQWNNCLCTLWPYSQLSTVLFVCIHNFGHTVIRILTFPLIKKTWLCYFQDNKPVLQNLTYLSFDTKKTFLCYSHDNSSLLLKFVRPKNHELFSSLDEVRQPCSYSRASEGALLSIASTKYH